MRWTPSGRDVGFKASLYHVVVPRERELYKTRVFQIAPAQDVRCWGDFTVTNSRIMILWDDSALTQRQLSDIHFVKYSAQISSTWRSRRNVPGLIIVYSDGTRESYRAPQAEELVAAIIKALLAL